MPVLFRRADTTKVSLKKALIVIFDRDVYKLAG